MSHLGILTYYIVERLGADADTWLLTVFNHPIQKVLMYITWASALQFCFSKDGASLDLLLVALAVRGPVGNAVALLRPQS